MWVLAGVGDELEDPTGDDLRALEQEEEFRQYSSSELDLFQEDADLGSEDVGPASQFPVPKYPQPLSGVTVSEDAVLTPWRPQLWWRK